MVNYKIMNVFYGEDLLPYKDSERSVHYPIVGNSFLGASNTTEIHFYIDRIGDINDVWVANSKLPNGKLGNEILKGAYDEELDENYVILKLNTFYTQAKGDLYISLNAFIGGVVVEENDGIYSMSGTPTIQATGSVKIAINYATPLANGDELSQITLQQLLAAIRTQEGVPYEGATRDVNIGEHTLYTIGGIAHPGEQGYPYISFVNGTFTFTPNATDNTYVIANSTLNYLEIDDVRNGLEYVFPNQGGTLALKSQVDAVAEMANGKTNTFVVYYYEYFNTILQTLNNDSLCGAILFDGTNYTDITENIKAGQTYSVYNPQLNSQVDQLTLYQSYLVVRTSYGDTKYNLSGFSQYSHTIYLFIDYNYPKAGDIVNIIETDVPDRWVSGKFSNGGLTFNKMETAKVDLSNYVDLTSNQTITGSKTFTNTVRFTSSIYGTNYNENFDDIYTTINNFNETDTNTEIKWSKTLTFSKSADTTFTFETPKLNCLNEYKAFITNGDSSAIVLTFTGVNNILCNDDNCIVSGNTLTLPSGTTIEINCMNNNLVAINWSAQ